MTRAEACARAREALRVRQLSVVKPLTLVEEARALNLVQRVPRVALSHVEACRELDRASRGDV